MNIVSTHLFDSNDFDINYQVKMCAVACLPLKTCNRFVFVFLVVRLLLDSKYIIGAK